MNIFFQTNQEIIEQITSRLSLKRKQLKLTQKELAEMSGVSFGAIQKFEKGQNFTISNFISILRALGELQSLGKLLEATTPSPKEIYLKEK
jgi:transcriptional regulator with XRE-family HTH domain